MKAINIRGINNSGKSIISKLLREHIVSSGIVEEIREDYIKSIDGRETFVVYKYNGKYIAIISQGDDENYVKKVTELIDNLNRDGIKLDYLFFTCRSRGKGKEEADRILEQAEQSFIFLVNRIQEDIDENEVMEQKNLFVNFILSVINFKEEFN